MPQMMIPLSPRGLVKNVARHLIPEGGVALSDNMVMFKGEFQIAPGFKDFDDQVLAGAQVMHLDEFPLEQGAVRLLAFTDDKAYAWDGVSAFTNITRQVASVDVDFTGGLDDAFQADVIVNPAGDLFYVVTNNKRDPVHKWDGVLVNRMTKLAGSPFDVGDHFSRGVAGFFNHLFHLNRVEGGTQKPRMLRWSANGEPENYSSGSASFLTLFQGADHGVSLFPLSSFLAAYRERSIHLVSFVGQPFWFAQRQVINGVGLLAPRALLNLDTRHVFLGNDNVYVFNGVDLEPIGDQIRTELFEQIDPDNAERSLIALDESRNVMMLIVPSPGSTFPDTWWFWDITEGTWFGPVRGRKASAAGVHERRTTETWDTSSGSWDTDAGIWDQAANIVGFPVNLFGNDVLKVFEIDPNLTTAGGVAVVGRVESSSVLPGVRLFDPPTREAVCTELLPLTAETNASAVKWFVGHSDNPTGPFTFEGPFTRGVRGVVKTMPVRGKWFAFAAEANVAFKVTGLVANFEPGGGA